MLGEFYDYFNGLTSAALRTDIAIINNTELNWEILQGWTIPGKIRKFVKNFQAIRGISSFIFEAIFK